MSNYVVMIAFVVGLVVTGAIGLQVDQSKGHFMSASLIHRDSPMSPFYNRSKSQSEIFGEAVTRSLDRINYMNSPMHIDAEDMESVIISDREDYFMKIHSGEEEYLLMILMEATFTTLKCDSSSKTNDRLDSYNMLSYDSMDCLISPNTNHVTDDEGSKMCHYELTYPKPNFASSIGVVSQATFHFDHSKGNEAHFRLMFGCSHRYIFKGPLQGIIGLGYGDFPFVAQLASETSVVISEKISYYLPPYHSEVHVKIIFGDKARNVISNKRVTLPFRTKTNSPFYYLTLQSVGYNGKYTDELISRHNMVLDFGSTITILDEKIFNEFMVIVSGAIPGTEFKVDDPMKKFEFCYDEKDEATFKGFEMKFRFNGGTLDLREENVFAQHMDMENLKCMMIKSTNRGPMVLGSYAQMNHLVEFDLNNNQISLVRADCEKEFGI